MTPSETQSEASAPKRNGRGWMLVPFLIFIALTGLFAFGLTGDPTKLPSALIGRPVPETAFPPLEGLMQNGEAVAGFGAADLAKGEVSVVNFWASWCVPCIEEHPLLIKLRERSGVTIYGVNHKDQPEAGRRFLGRYGNPFAAIGTDGNGRAAIEWGVYGVPETFVIDKDGVIRHKHIGPITTEALQRTILPLVRKLQQA